MDFRKKLLRTGILTLFALTFAGCSDKDIDNHNDLTETPAATTTPTPSEAPEQNNLNQPENLSFDGEWPYFNRSLEGSYAEVISINLLRLGMKNVQQENVKIIEGENLVEDLLVTDDEIRFITPEDPGHDQKIVLLLEKDSKQKHVSIDVSSSRPVAIVETTDYGNEESASERASFRVKGLGGRHELSDNDLVMEVDDNIVLSESISNGLLHVGDASPVSMNGHWTRTPSGNGFSIKAEQLKNLLGDLPPGDVLASVMLNGEGDNSMFAREWEFLIHIPEAELNGRIVDEETSLPITILKGKKVAIVGSGDNAARLVREIDEHGRFSAKGLSSGRYIAKLLDTRLPEFSRAEFIVKRNAKEVSVSIPYFADAYRSGKRVMEKLPPKTMTPKINSENTTQRSTLIEGEIMGRNCHKVLYPPAEDYSFSVTPTHFEYDTPYSCFARMTIPKGVKNVEINVVVGSDKITASSSSRSSFNDTWFYSLAGLPVSIQGDSQDRKSPDYGFLLEKRKCVNVSELTDKGPHEFFARIGATNVGDPHDVISVIYRVKDRCTEKTEIKDAVFASKNKKGYMIIRPLKATGKPGSNHKGAYISLPDIGTSAEWGIPMQVTFGPGNAVLRDINMIIVGGNGQTKFGILDQVTSIKNHDDEVNVNFENLVFPKNVAFGRFSGSVRAFVEVHVEIDGTTHTSPMHPVSLNESNDVNFTPLFFSGIHHGSERRYGGRDAGKGGDSWGAWGALQWLDKNDYVYNDISPLHVAQTPNGRSIIGHAGHSDGFQIDLRYSDANGGYKGTYSGMEDGKPVLAMLERAKNDVMRGQHGSSRDLQNTIKWITENRLLLEGEAKMARVIYAGHDWMASALRDGVFPGKNGGRIPYAGTGSDGGYLPRWDSVPKNIKFGPPHFHHWHISLLPTVQ